jgi:aspartate carbamoyltransferase catalytic subunit
MNHLLSIEDLDREGIERIVAQAACRRCAAGRC